MWACRDICKNALKFEKALICRYVKDVIYFYVIYKSHYSKKEKQGEYLNISRLYR